MLAGLAAFQAIKQRPDAAKRDRSLDRAHLPALIDRYGGQARQWEVTQYFGQIAKHWPKWAQYTGFVTDTVFTEGDGERPVDPAIWQVFPDERLSRAPGARITSSDIRLVEAPDSDDQIANLVVYWLVPESLAVKRVLDNSAVMAGAVRIHVVRAHAARAVHPAPDRPPQDRKGHPAAVRCRD